METHVTGHNAAVSRCLTRCLRTMLNAENNASGEEPDTMSIHGDYAVSIVHDQRSRELQAEARRDSMARQALAVVKRGAAGRKARSAARSRARTA